MKTKIITWDENSEKHSSQKKFQIDFKPQEGRLGFATGKNRDGTEKIRNWIHHIFS